MAIKKITELVTNLYEKSWLPVFSIGTIADVATTRMTLVYEDFKEYNPLANYLMENFGTDTGLVLVTAISIPLIYGVGKLGRYVYSISNRYRIPRLTTEIYRDKRAFTFYGILHLAAAGCMITEILKT